ncbi:hypothetical protein KI387_020532, partial [Taxus chinensis]
SATVLGVGCVIVNGQAAGVNVTKSVDCMDGGRLGSLGEGPKGRRWRLESLI